MIISFAPMEGLTDWKFRCIHHKLFPGTDRYYTYFLTPCEQGLKGKTLKEVLPENNMGLDVIPQILTNNASGFLSVVEKVSELGYKEVNLNLGCPSGTVFSKKRGSGFLAEPDKLKTFLDEIFKKSKLEISVKTRIGVKDEHEFAQLLEIYNEFPIKELIVHPRTREDFYQGSIHWSAFEYAMSNSKQDLAYNGNIFSVEDYKKVVSRFPTINHVMLGRGFIANPALARECNGGEKLEKKELQLLYEELFDASKEYLSGTQPVLCHMKAYWTYWGTMFADAEKFVKQIKKAQTLENFHNASLRTFESCELI